uniref:Uncharacterized protein n=1 Tax=Strongyloides papillosus TaxID=174720 RepID=A0A0N5CC18_STREA
MNNNNTGRPGNNINNPIILDDSEGEMEIEEDQMKNSDTESEGETENINDSPDFTSPIRYERYNHLCLYHRGYYPQRGTGTNRSNNNVTGILIKIKTWSNRRDPSRYINIIRDHADLVDLEIHLQQQANPKTKILMERILSLRRWRRIRIIADRSWIQYGNMYPDYGNLVIIYKNDETD